MTRSSARSRSALAPLLGILSWAKRKFTFSHTLIQTFQPIAQTPGARSVRYLIAIVSGDMYPLPCVIANLCLCTSQPTGNQVAPALASMQSTRANAARLLLNAVAGVYALPAEGKEPTRPTRPTRRQTLRLLFGNPPPRITSNMDVCQPQTRCAAVR